MAKLLKPQSDWRTHLPEFETPAAAADMQRRVANALRRLKSPEAEAAVRSCTFTDPCHSGLCPRCIRALRLRLLNFLQAERLHHSAWFLVTIRVEGWTVAPGDNRPFGLLRNHRHVEALLTKIRRLRRSNVIIFGSIETAYRTVANAPVGKPFHLHLMISGLTEEDIRRAISGTIPLLSTDVVPLDVREVGPTKTDFYGAASYAFKQPFIKRSAARAGLKGDLQAPSSLQLRELIGNFGVHGWTGRLILSGIRCDRGKFRMLANLSATTSMPIRP